VPQEFTNADEDLHSPTIFEKVLFLNRRLLAPNFTIYFGEEQHL
jgi:hypothetical protein